PCPYCGAPTTIKQQRCTQCRASLMERAPRAERRSLALTVLGTIWVVGGVGMLVGAALLGVLLVLQREAPAGTATPSSFLAIVLAAVFLFGLLCFGVARGLLARVREFYFRNIALILIGIVVRVGLLFRGVALLSGIVALAGSNASPWSGVLSTTALVLPIVLGVLLVLFPLILSILCYRDFFPPLAASNLVAQGVSARGVYLRLPPITRKLDFNTRTFAQLFDDPAFREDVGRQLRQARGDATRIGLPAVLGLKDPLGAVAHLQQLSG
ncbi:hypothetical protein SE17_39530, partial [Kouleothrix aurantiaca]